MSTRLSAGRVRSTYEFINAHRHEYGLRTMCRVLEVAPSGYYDGLKQPISNRAKEDARLLRLIRASFTASQGIYGAPRVFLDLRESWQRSLRSSVGASNMGKVSQSPAIRLSRASRYALGVLWLWMGAFLFPGVVHALASGEREVLAALYSSTNGDNWTDNTNWFGAAGTECTWFGITCDGSQYHVTEVSLAANNLSGTLPSLAGLTNLQVFEVESNHLTGNLPALSSLTSLTSFSVGINQLTGSIPALDGLTNLKTFYAINNQLTGSIPALAGLTNLHVFSVFGNQLTGGIPALANLTNLETFDVHYNNLDGAIPALTGLANIRYFSVGHNHLTGTLPELTGLSNLYYFVAGFNDLTGSIPALSIDLEYFFVDHNHLTGSIPVTVGLPFLAHLGVGFNQLTGPVPPASGSLLSFSASYLCPNPLDTTPGANDAGWNKATGFTPWWATPHADNTCDDLFSNSFE